MPLIFYIALFTAAGVVGVIGYVVWRYAERKYLLEQLQMELYLIRLPNVSKEGREIKAEIGLFERLVSALATFGKPFVFEAAVPHVGEEIYFFVAVPRRIGGALMRQVHGLWSGASVERVDDYNVFHPAGVVAGATLSLRDKYLFPVRSYEEFESDPFQSILSGLSKINEIGEGGAVQVLIRPAPRSVKTRVLSSIRRLRKGEEFAKVMGKSVLKDTINFVLEGDKKQKEEKQRPPIVDEFAIKALEAKASKPLFLANVRLVASAPDSLQAEDILNGLTAGFSQFSAPERNEFVVNRVRNTRELAYLFSFREFDQGRSMILNTAELASIFHFTTPFSEVPRVKSLKAKQASPPSVLSRAGVLIGESSYRGEMRPVMVSDDDRRRHVYVIGQTGTGKSTLITNMASYDVAAGKGVAVIDPHGDLVWKVLSQIPPQRMDDVILFDPSDLEQPLGINMLEYNFSRPEEKTFIVNEMVSIFDRLYDLKATGGPMFEQYMRNALLLLMEDMPNEPATLMEVSRVFTDPPYRRRKLERIRNPIVQDFWQKEAEKAGGDAALQNITPYITSKFNTFTANDYMRVIIGQERSAFSFREVMDEGKILLINLSKGRIGDINANLLGMIFVGKILMAALSRVDIDEEARRDFNLYIDEFQNFTTDSIATILSEARKYRLNLVVAHQFIAQLSEKIRDAVFGNVGSVVGFRVGVQDAEFLVKQFAPVFDEHDLANIDNRNAYVKLLIDGATAPPFNIRTLPPPQSDRAVAEGIRERSRARYGRSRSEVEDGIYRRLRV